MNRLPSLGIRIVAKALTTMPDLLQQGAAWLSTQLKSNVSGDVIYRRGATTVTVSAVRGATQFEEGDDFGRLLRREIRDFLIEAADLVLDSVLIQPERGDQIIFTEAGFTWTYEVAGPGNEPPWRWSDRHHTQIRIHTKFTGKA